MKKWNLLLATLLALLMCLSCVTAAAETNSMYPWHEEGVTLTLIRFTDQDIGYAGTASYADAPGFQAWQEQTGIKIDIKEFPDDAALKLYVSGDTLPDIIAVPFGSFSGGELRMAEDGLCIPLTDLIKEKAPDYYNFINSNEVYTNAIRASDGNIYRFQGFFLADSAYRAWRGMMVRQDFLDALDMEPPTTIDEFTDMLRAFKDELGVEIPFINASNNFFNFLGDGNLTSGFGLPTPGGYQVDGVYHYGAYEPEYKDVLEYLNMLYTEGLLDPNFAVTNEPTAQSSVMTGKSGAIYAAASRILAMTNGSEDENFKLVGLVPFEKNKGEIAMKGFTDPVSVSLASYITADCKNVDAACAFLNYLYSEPGNILYNFGVEGLSFVYNEEGLPTYTDIMTKNPDGYSLDPLIRKYGVLNFSGVQSSRMSEQRYPLVEQIEAYAAWSTHTADKYLIINDATLPEYLTEASQLATDISTYVSEMRVKFISGEESLDKFDDYLATLKDIGIERYIEIKQLSLDANLGKNQ